MINLESEQSGERLDERPVNFWRFGSPFIHVPAWLVSQLGLGFVDEI